MVNRRAQLLQGRSPNPTKGPSVETKLTEYEFQNVLQAMNVLIPNDVIISLYNVAGKKKVANSRKSVKGASEKRLRITEIKDHLNKTTSDIQESTTKASIKRLAVDKDFFFTFLWFVGGICLVLAASITILPEDIVRYLYVTNSIFYAMSSIRFIVSFPIDEYRGQASSERLMKRFRKAMLENSADYYETTKLPSEPEQSVFVQLLTYIEHKLYDGNPYGDLTRRDIDLLLLKCLGSSYNSRASDDIMASVDTDNQGTVSPAELHHFLSEDTKKKKNKEPSLCSRFIGGIFASISRAICVLKTTVKDFQWLSTVCFLAASGISISLFFISEFDLIANPWPIFGMMTPWLGLIGTFSFSVMAYDYEAVRVDRADKMRQILSACVKYAQHYHRDNEIWVNYNKNNGLDKDSVGRLMEESGIMLTPDELNALFDKIDDDNSGLLSKEELDAYFDSDRDRQIEIILACFKSWNFWATLCWSIGSILYIMPVYFSTGALYDYWCYVGGAVCYLIGAIGCVNMAFESMAHKVKNLLKLTDAVDKLIAKHDLSGFRASMHRFKSQIFDCSDDVEAQKELSKKMAFQRMSMRSVTLSIDESPGEGSEEEDDEYGKSSNGAKSGDSVSTSKTSKCSMEP